MILLLFFIKIFFEYLLNICVLRLYKFFMVIFYLFSIYYFLVLSSFIKEKMLKFYCFKRIINFSFILILLPYIEIKINNYSNIKFISLLKH